MLFLFIVCVFGEIYSIKDLQNATEFAHLHNLRHLKKIHEYDIFEGYLKKRNVDLFVDFKKKQFKRYFRNEDTDPLFTSQWHLPVVGYSDANTGKGVNIAIVDDGLKWDHPDLRANYVSGLSYDYNGRDGDPTPYYGDSHGTSCAGVAAAAKNYVCGRGIAPQASLIGIRLIAEPVYDYQEAEGLSHKRDKIRIYSSSWGPSDDGMNMAEPGPVVKSVLKQGFESGHNIYVWAAGNGRHLGDSSNYDGYANSEYTFAIGAVDYNGNQAFYSESGANLLAVAPSSGVNGYGIVTTGGIGCTRTFGGTSSAAPLAAGIIALILQARPDFTVRDVQHVIAKYATKKSGAFHSNEYGFGLLYVPPILEGCKTFQKVKPFKRVIYGSDERLTFIEQVLVTITMSHTKRGDIEVNVTSPKTTSVLATKHGDNHSGSFTWTYKSLRHWGEEYKKGDRWVVSAGPGTVQSTKIEFIGMT